MSTGLKLHKFKTWYIYLKSGEVLRGWSVGNGLSDWTRRQNPAGDLEVVGGKL